MFLELAAAKRALISGIDQSHSTRSRSAQNQHSDASVECACSKRVPVTEDQGSQDQWEEEEHFPVRGEDLDDENGEVGDHERAQRAPNHNVGSPPVRADLGILTGGDGGAEVQEDTKKMLVLAGRDKRAKGAPTESPHHQGANCNGREQAELGCARRKSTHDHTRTRQLAIGDQ
jgi:hypothetical protein